MMIGSRNIRYLFVIAISIGVVFAIIAPKLLLSSAYARSDFCKQFPDNAACQKGSSNFLDKRYKCEDQAAKDGVITPKEMDKCGHK